MSSRHRILNRTVPGEVGTEDFPVAHLAVRNNQAPRQRAVEVADHAQPEARRYIDIAAKRNLVSAIQQRWPEEPVRLVVVDRLNDKVLIGFTRRAVHLRSAGVLKPGQAVGQLEISSLYTPQRVVDVLR